MTEFQKMAHEYAANDRITIDQMCKAAGVSERAARAFLGDRRQGKNFTSLVKLCDWHVPYEDKRSLGCAFNFCEETQPDIILLDEVHDFYGLSRFSQDPLRSSLLQDEIDAAKKYFKRLKKICPGSRIILLNSNHLDRLRKYLWTDGRALAGLKCLQLEKLLDLQELDIEYYDNFFIKNVLFKHGNIVRKHSAYTARGEFEREGCSGATGHTHRLGVHFVTKRGGKYVWVEGGCLCDLDPEYIEGVADWQHGLTQFTFEREGNLFFPQAIPIIDGKMIYGGKVITD